MALRHNYTRPAWLCVACGVPWPCASKRAEYLAKFSDPDDEDRLRGRARLRMILGTLALDAEKDMPDMPKGETYTRFIEWTYEPMHQRKTSAPLWHPGFKS
jgi:hypothetical protein